MGDSGCEGAVIPMEVVWKEPAAAYLIKLLQHNAAFDIPQMIPL